MLLHKEAFMLGSEVHSPVNRELELLAALFENLYAF